MLGVYRDDKNDFFAFFFLNLRTRAQKYNAFLKPPAHYTVFCYKDELSARLFYKGDPLRI
jgi:hypothetical protein